MTAEEAASAQTEPRLYLGSLSGVVSTWGRPQTATVGPLLQETPGDPVWVPGPRLGDLLTIFGECLTNTSGFLLNQTLVLFLFFSKGNIIDLHINNVIYIYVYIQIALKRKNTMLQRGNMINKTAPVFCF
ncbi:unnamed protein product [Arctogadus glacialis]